MKTKGNKQEKINVVTLGCSKNLYDSEVLMTQLRGNDISVTGDAVDDEAQTVVINTCGFIENAKQESIDTILRYADAKKEGQIGKLYVTGCLSQRYREDLKAEIAEVDEWFGTNELPQLLNSLHADYKHDLVGEKPITTPNHYTYLKISEGCDRPCSFCAIPLMRGKHVSVAIEELVKRSENLARNGVKELILIAQDSTFYGKDIYGEYRLPDLLRNLSDVEGIDWIRLQYAYPSRFPEETLDVIKERDNICNYLDMPLQHISDNMLKIMRRGITKRRTLDLVDTIRQKTPDIALRTTMLVGHPGETEQDFEELMQFVEETKFDRLGVFTYSHEENTHAHTLSDDIPEEVKEERAAAVMELQQQISLEKNKAKIGTIQKVLIDRKENSHFVGRTECDSPEVDNEVLIDAKHYLRIGDFSQIKITAAEEFDLFGVPVN